MYLCFMLASHFIHMDKLTLDHIVYQPILNDYIFIVENSIKLFKAHNKDNPIQNECVKYVIR